jgi:hypothetical protein
LVRVFHAMAILAGSLLHGKDGEDHNVSSDAGTVLLTQFINNWFSHTRSTEPIVIGSINKEADVLQFLSKMPHSKNFVQCRITGVKFAFG